MACRDRGQVRVPPSHFFLKHLRLYFDHTCGTVTCPCATRCTSIYKGLATFHIRCSRNCQWDERRFLGVGVQALASNPLQAAAVGNVNPVSSHVKSQCRTVLATSNAITCLWHCGMRHRGGRTVIQARWRNVGSRSRNAKGNAEQPKKNMAKILWFWKLCLSLHKISCILAKQPSKLVDFALDLHYLCTR